MPCERAVELHIGKLDNSQVPANSGHRAFVIVGKWDPLFLFLQVRLQAQKEWVPFTYNDKGTMATVGRNLAIVELPNVKFYGTFAWLIWMFVHLMSIVGIRNRFLILINWFWNYVTYDTSLRLILKPKGC